MLLNSRGLRAKRSPTAINFGPFRDQKILLKKQEVVGLLSRARGVSAGTSDEGTSRINHSFVKSGF